LQIKGPLGKVAAIAIALLAIAPPAHGEEQTRESYVAQVEPICKVNRQANERIMDGARKRINKKEFEQVGKQFIRVSESFKGLVKRIAAVPPPPPPDDHRVDRWLGAMRLLKTRLRTVGKYYKEGEDIKAAHESILAERSGIVANNISIVFHVHYCRFGRFEQS
jgi:hypothetical protein